jgi:hypothetical protein
MAVLHAAGAARDRKVLWCTLSDDDTESARAADVADTTTNLGTATDNLTQGSWTLPANTVVVVDHAAAAQSCTIAELAAHARRSRATLILLDPDENRWPPGPADETAPRRPALGVNSQHQPGRRGPPDTPTRPRPHPRPSRPPQRGRCIDELRDALARRTQLREQHQASYRVHTALQHDADRASSRDQNYGREL